MTAVKPTERIGKEAKRGSERQETKATQSAGCHQNS